jgi:mannitol 2-dehydrogenase
MVDRITPVTTDMDRVDAGHDAVVVAEPFRQWVLEDAFVGARPVLELAGVQVVGDVSPYELMKLRLLNGGHQALAYPAALLGHEWVHAAARDERVGVFVQRWLAEAMPTLPPVPGIDLAAYTRRLLERFGNPHVADTVARLCAFTSDRIPVFVLPAIRANLSAGRPVEVTEKTVDSRAVASGEALLKDPAVTAVGSDLRVREPFLRALALLRNSQISEALTT